MKKFPFNLWVTVDNDNLLFSSFSVAVYGIPFAVASTPLVKLSVATPVAFLLTYANRF
ncbi:MAG: hypothetical protein ACE5J6_01580 [Candidatus Bathyarchaeia archaeon]